MIADHVSDDPPPETLPHDVRNCLAVAFGRVQLLRRLAGRGDVDPAWLARQLDEVDGCLRRLAGLIDALEAGSRPALQERVAALDD